MTFASLNELKSFRTSLPQCATLVHGLSWAEGNRDPERSRETFTFPLKNLNWGPVKNKSYQQKRLFMTYIYRAGQTSNF